MFEKLFKAEAEADEKARPAGRKKAAAGQTAPKKTASKKKKPICR
jgi:hypothetical protein